MALASCKRCRKLYEKIRKPICPSCEQTEELEFLEVRKYVADHPKQNAEQVAEGTGIDIEVVLRCIEEDLIALEESPLEVRCGRCGAPAISVSKRLCRPCLEKLNAELAAEQAKVKLEYKKPVVIGSRSGLRPVGGDMTGDSGGVKYRR
jgi:ribosomal protein L37E